MRIVLEILFIKEHFRFNKRFPDKIIEIKYSNVSTEKVHRREHRSKNSTNNNEKKDNLYSRKRDTENRRASKEKIQGLVRRKTQFYNVVY